jgi:hypothetical protein
VEGLNIVCDVKRRKYEILREKISAAFFLPSFFFFFLLLVL